MRLLSANLESSTAWEEDALAVAAAIFSDAGADVAAVQECPGEGHLKALAALLGFQYRIAPSPTGLHTGLLWRPEITEVGGGDKYAERTQGTWHGFTSSTLVADGWPCPLTVISAHLIPHSTQAAIEEAQFIQSRVIREGYPGILVGDLNHLAQQGPEPDWSQVPLHNRASRTVLDPARPEDLVGDRRVGLVLTRAGLVDVAAARFEATGDETLLDHTGVYGRVRVDQAWVTGQLAGAIVGYERLDHRGITDHHPIQVDLNLEDLAAIERVEYH